jgi:hypothetical protein
MDNLEIAPLTCCFTKAGLAAGTTTTLTQTLAGGATSNIFAIRGKTYSATALSNTATPTTDWATGKAFLPILANQGCVFMVGFNAAGALKAIQGQVVALDTVTVPGNFLTAPQFGALGPAGSGQGAGGGNDFCPIGYLVIQAGSTASNTTGWTFGSNNMSSVTGITYTFDDVCGITDRPQVS